WSLAGCASFALALLSAEGGIAALAYLAAHALVLDRNSVRARAIALAPYLGVLAVWRVLYLGAGGGVTGCGFYRAIGSDPLGFAAGVAAAIPIYLVSQLTFPFAGLSALLPHALWPLAFCSAGVAFWLARYFRPLLAADESARFFALATVLSIVPLGATLP